MMVSKPKPNPISKGMSKRLRFEVPTCHMPANPVLGARYTPTQPTTQMAPMDNVSVRFTIWLAICPEGNKEMSRRKMTITTNISRYVMTEGDIFLNIIRPDRLFA